MVLRMKRTFVGQRKRIVPALVALSLLAGVIVSLVSTPNAQADYYTGCGYGYSSTGTFGYGSGYGYGDGNGNTTFGYGNGNQVCPSTGGGGGGGGGGGTTTTTTAGTTTTTTGATTTTTAPARGGSHRFFCRGEHGFGLPGRTLTMNIFGLGFFGQPKITSNEFGTRFGVLHDRGNVLITHVTVGFGSRRGEHTLTVHLADGRSCKANYSVK